MTPSRLTIRSGKAELMDAPDVDPDALDHAMRHLEMINTLLNGYGPTLSGIRNVIPATQKSFTLLDVGCGSGDTLRRIARWSRRRGLTAKLVGIELSAQSAESASKACEGFPEIEIRCQDLFSISTDETFDIAHCALVLHHFSKDEDAVKALVRMRKIAKKAVIVNDLHRHPLAYNSIKGLTRVFSRSEILRNDAPLSVARAFTRKELLKLADEAGLRDVIVKWHWAFRWLMIGHGTDAG